jgi:tRNA pseudouridine32 synthase/23S rRNA pseudouridine746 synthase
VINNTDEFIAPVCHDQIEILYQDESILVINKPSGLLTLSGKNPLNIDSVHHRLVKDFPEALMVHRLDFGTSGIMLVALSKDIVKKLNRQFSERQVFKEYHATLDGVLKESSGSITFPIAKGEFPYQKVCTDTGKLAETQYRVLERLKDRTQVVFIPVTGRTHQLRVHSQAIGHSIIGCDLYGTQSSLSKSQRLMLHASRLEFNHPISKTRMDIKHLGPFE